MLLSAPAPIRLKLGKYEALALQQYFLKMYKISMQSYALPDEIILAENFYRIDRLVRAKLFSHNPKEGFYSVPLSVAIILWEKWQKEPRTFELQNMLAKLDYELNRFNRVPKLNKVRSI